MNMTVARALIPAFAFSSAAPTEKALEEEAEEKKVGNFRLPLLQIFEQSYALSSADRALEIAGFSATTPELKTVVWLTPFLTFFAVELLPDGILRSGIQYFQKHFGRVCAVAIAVSQIVIFAYTQSPLALIVLAVQLIGVADRYQWLPSRVSSFYHHFSLPIYTICQVAAYGFFSLWGTLAIIGLITEWWPSDAVDAPRPLEREQAVPERLKLNYDHLRWKNPTEEQATLLQHLEKLRAELFSNHLEAQRYNCLRKWLIQRGFPNETTQVLRLKNPTYPALFARKTTPEKLTALNYTKQKIIAFLSEKNILPSAEIPARLFQLGILVEEEIPAAEKT